jgi:hypothetical protein
MGIEEYNTGILYQYMRAVKCIADSLSGAEET